MLTISNSLRNLKKLYYKYNIRIIKTLIVNFRLLPFSVARHLPIVVYGKTSICLGGKSKIVIKCSPRYGLMRIGFQMDHQMSSYQPCHFLMTGGTLILNGQADFSPGTTLRID